MANSQEIIDAASDNDLMQRAVVLGISLGISEAGVRDSFWKIVAGSVAVGDQTTSVASAYASAKTLYDNALVAAKAAYDEAMKNLPPTPGKNLAGVTDEILIKAISELSYMSNTPAANDSSGSVTP